MANTTPIAPQVVIYGELETLGDLLHALTRVPGLVGDLTDWIAAAPAGCSLLSTIGSGQPDIAEDFQGDTHGT